MIMEVFIGGLLSGICIALLIAAIFFIDLRRKTDRILSTKGQLQTQTIERLNKELSALLKEKDQLQVKCESMRQHLQQLNRDYLDKIEVYKLEIERLKTK